MTTPPPSVPERYERPHHLWVCGRSQRGEPCRSGPDRRGRCGGQNECRPVRRGDRWHCTRPILAGGPCAEGATPDGRCGRPPARCQPLRTPRGWTRFLMRWTFFATIGLVLVITYGARVLELISPGPLNPFHSAIDHCAVCHVAAEKGPRGWLRLALGRTDPRPDNARCLTCHPLGNHAQAPHSLDPDILKRHEAKMADWPSPPVLPVTLHRAASLLNPDLGRQTPLECGLCHQEHRGHTIQERWWAEDRCNACHRRATARFVADHPPFASYPHTLRTAIKFDHRSHLRKHFSGKLADKAPRDCHHCHPDDGIGNRIAAIRFQPACGACHVDQIREVFRSGPKGLTFISLPPLDLDTLRARGVAIGEWPATSDGALSPFMSALFADTEAVTRAYTTLAGVDTQNLAAATPAQLEAIATWVWTIKGFIFDLLTQGRPVLAERLQRLLGTAPDAQILAQLSGQMPADL
ncbi:MAG: hypothetical protein HQL66_07450, partial [Magnetococcales bacterium]|nr:hypothetical protein [Magnetococcales bacterium]